MPPTHRVGRNRRTAVVAGAFLVVALVVGAVFALALPRAGDAATNEGLHEEGALSPADQVVADADRVLPGLALPADAATTAIADAQGRLDHAAADAEAAIQAAADAGAGDLSSAVADTGALPTVPAGYAVGDDVTGHVGDVNSLPYLVPAIDSAPVRLQSAGALSTVQSVGGSFATGSGLRAPATGVEQVDGTAGGVTQLDDAYRALQGQDLDQVLGGLGDPTANTPASGLVPTDEVVATLLGDQDPSGTDPTSAANPDREGAENALDFGFAVAGGVSDAFSVLDADATAIASAQDDLLPEVQGLAAEARALEADGVASVEHQLEGRLAEAETTTALRIRELSEAHDAYVAAVTGAQAAAEADAKATVEAKVAAVQSEADAQVQTLTDAAGRIQQTAERRMNDVDAQTASYLGELAAIQAETGDDLSAQADAVRARADAVKADIQASAEAQNAALVAAASDLQVQGDARVASLLETAASLPDLSGQAQAAVAAAATAQAFGEAVAHARYLEMVDAHAVRAQADIDAVHADAQARIDAVRAAAGTFLDDADDAATEGMALVEQVQADGDANVGAAVTYVLKVADDYSSVPEPSRAEAAAELQAAADALAGAGEGAYDLGFLPASQFDAVLQHSDELRGTLAVLVL